MTLKSCLAALASFFLSFAGPPGRAMDCPAKS